MFIHSAPISAIIPTAPLLLLLFARERQRGGRPPFYPGTKGKPSSRNLLEGPSLCMAPLAGLLANLCASLSCSYCCLFFLFVGAIALPATFFFGLCCPGPWFWFLQSRRLGRLTSFLGCLVLLADAKQIPSNRAFGRPPVGQRCRQWPRLC